VDENDMQRAQQIAEQLAAAKHEREEAIRKAEEEAKRNDEQGK